MRERNRNKVAVIGAGLGGISAAVSLAQAGYKVEVFEKNEKIGGKLNVLSAHGYTFDLGPSILTLPHVFERLFSRSGRQMSDYFSIRRIRPHWRNFFEHGKVIDLYPEPGKMAEEARKAGEEPEAVRSWNTPPGFMTLSIEGTSKRAWIPPGTSEISTGLPLSPASTCSTACTAAFQSA
jgi:diapolycopene oxygenase